MIGGMRGRMVLQSRVLEHCLQGDSWTGTSGLPLGVHLGSMGRQMGDTWRYLWGLTHLTLFYITHGHSQFFRCCLVSI